MPPDKQQLGSSHEPAQPQTLHASVSAFRHSQSTHTTLHVTATWHRRLPLHTSRTDSRLTSSTRAMRRYPHPSRWCSTRTISTWASVSTARGWSCPTRAPFSLTPISRTASPDGSPEQLRITQPRPLHHPVDLFRSDLAVAHGCGLYQPLSHRHRKVPTHISSMRQSRATVVCRANTIHFVHVQHHSILATLTNTPGVAA